MLRNRSWTALVGPEQNCPLVLEFSRARLLQLRPVPIELGSAQMPIRRCPKPMVIVIYSLGY